MAALKSSQRAAGFTDLTSYLQDVGSVALLTAEEEGAIARQIETSRGELLAAIVECDLALDQLDLVASRLRMGKLSARRAALQSAGGETPGNEGLAAAIEGFVRVCHQRRSRARRGLGKAARGKLVGLLADLALDPSTLDELVRRAGSLHGGESDASATALAAAHRRLRHHRGRLVEANLRLVVYVARKFSGSGMPLADLIQEGNLGLLRAAEKFDYRRGRFSTYATWWIRQSVARAVAEQGRTIRLPVHVSDLRARLRRQLAILRQALDRQPTVAELAEAAAVPEGRVEQALAAASVTLSLQAPIGEDDDNVFESIVADGRAIDPLESAEGNELERQTRRALASLSQREERILRLRFGIGERSELTLEEVGRQFSLTRERIRQIEARALGKLRCWMRSQPDLVELIEPPTPAVSQLSASF